MHNAKLLQPLKLLAIVALSLAGFAGQAQEKTSLFSGPQAGERITPFQVLDLIGPKAGQKRTIAAADQSEPLALIFVHQVERSIVPLLRVIDAYADQKKEGLRTEFVFLSDDPLAAQQRLPLVRQSLKLKSPISLSVDGSEGPGNYGLNKSCLLTLVFAKDHRVSGNFALIQPGIADAPKVIAALAKIVGDPNPPRPEELLPDRFATRDQENMRPADKAKRPQKELPGAAPTDAQLISLLRRFIQLSNSPADVDAVLKDVRQYVSGNGDLTRQTVDGWTRVIHLEYGTEYARKMGRELLQELKKK